MKLPMLVFPFFIAWLILHTLKLTGVINWSWWIVLSPLVPFFIIFVLGLVVVVKRVKSGEIELPSNK